MLIYNPEIKSFLKRYIVMFMLSSFIALGLSIYSINVIKYKVVENNQIILGNILVKHPQLEKDIVNIITQQKDSENKELGKRILKQYNYGVNTKLNYEPIISKSFIPVLGALVTLVILVFGGILLLILLTFKKLYEDIEDMTTYIYNSSNGQIYNLKNRNQEGKIGILKTELLKMTSTLRENIELLKNEKIFLNNTISDISHQLRTPMTSLMILNDLMYGDLEKEVKVEFLDKIKSQLNRMDWLIKSMLKLSKVEAKVIEFKRESINIENLIHRSVQPILLTMQMKKQKLDINGDVNASFIGDINWTTEALVNIIKNCVEHTQNEGKIEISFEENPIYSEIIIKDNGEGIEEKDIAHIFKRFYKGANSSKVESVGIGLSMAKSIISSQNGDIHVKSKKGIGSEFHITFSKDNKD